MQAYLSRFCGSAAYCIFLPPGKTLVNKISFYCEQDNVKVSRVASVRVYEIHADILGGRAHSCARKWTAKRAGAHNYKVLINWVQKEA